MHPAQGPFPPRDSMLVTTRDRQRTQCSLLVQQALGTLDRRHAGSMLSPSPVPPELEPAAVAETVHKAFTRCETMQLSRS